VIALAAPFGLVIGVIVGAVGGGGAILALPVLVYVLNEPIGPATTASLVVVAVAASVGAGSLARGGHVCWRLALTFSLPAAAGSLAGAIANKHVGGAALIIAFVPVMITAAFATWRRAGASDQPTAETCDCPEVDLLQIAGAGLGVGLLTGFFGVGGGFVIVPVLTLGFKLSFRRSVATSLVIITLVGLAALASHLAQGAHIIVGVTIALAAATAAGALLGTLIGERLPQHILGRGFSILVALVAAFLLVDTIAFHGPPGR
jgi:uncharacterized protein